MDPSSSSSLGCETTDDGIHFDIKPNTGTLTSKVVDDISEHYVLMPSILPTHPTRCPVIDTLLPFSSEIEGQRFHTGIFLLQKIAPDYEDSRAHGFVLRSLELQALA
ncbi:hypothetical protein Tco_0193997 [Tanacetum coccineum]